MWFTVVYGNNSAAIKGEVNVKALMENLNSKGIKNIKVFDLASNEVNI